jgi:hypothetical protein
MQNRLSKEELEEIKRFIKKTKKAKNEGSTTAGVPGFATPKAFVGDETADGTQAIDLQDDQYSYSKKPSKKKKHFIKLHEISYKTFKQDDTLTEVQKVNRRILEVSKRLREISQALDHSIKLKQESSLDNTAYWKRTNEAILKIHKRVSEVMKKTTKLANLKELAANSLKDQIVKLLRKAGIPIQASDISHNQIGSDSYELDIYIGGEPYGIDYVNGELIYQDVDKEVPLGLLKDQEAVINNIKKTFNV